MPPTLPRRLAAAGATDFHADPRWRGRVALTAAVLLLHAWALLRMPSPGRGTPGSTGPAMQVRQIVRASGEAAAPRPRSLPHAAVEPPADRTADAPVHAPSHAPVHAPVGAAPDAQPDFPIAAPTGGKAFALAGRTAPEQPAAASLPAQAVATGAATLSGPDLPGAPDAPVASGQAAVPVYAAQTPGSAVLRYALRRGDLRGHAELRWQVDGEHFQLELRSVSGSRPGPGSSSTGRVGATGLAPDRHTENRRGRELRAVNFQRDSARVTFSGPRTELPLVAGAQDRLSWLVQLAAITEANPALRTPGAEIRVFVIGARGDAETWLYTVVGRDELDLPIGTVPAALHLHREPQRLYDTQADIWLDPARQHLPVRVQWRLRATGEGSEWLLESQPAP